MRGRSGWDDEGTVHLIDHPITPAPEPAELDSASSLLALASSSSASLVIWQTTQIRLTPVYSQVGPRVIPYIVGAGWSSIGRLARVSRR